MGSIEIELTQITTDINYLERKNIQLRGEVQCLKDRIAGLVKENDTLKREATIRRVVCKAFNDLKIFVNNIKNLWNNFRNQKLG